MSVIFQIFLTISIIIVTYFIYLYHILLSARKKLNWIPAAPRVPILGSVFEFGNTAETLNDVARLTKNPSKLSYTEVLVYWRIFVRDYDLMEFIMSSNVVLNKSQEYTFLTDWLGTGLLTAPGGGTMQIEWSQPSGFCEKVLGAVNYLGMAWQVPIVGLGEETKRDFCQFTVSSIIISGKWKKRRRVITPAFHFSILEQFVDVFESNGKILIQKLYDEAVNKESVDIYSYVTACALDIISESAMGVNVNTQQNKNQDYVFAVKDMCRIAITRSTSSWKRFNILHRFTSDYGKEKKYLKILHNFSNNVIQERKQEKLNKTENKKGVKDDLGRKRKLAFLDLLLNSTIDGHPLSQEDIREEVDTFMFERQAREEQKKIYGKDRDAQTSYQDLQDMKYLEMVIKEALRLFPPVPVIGRKLHQDIEYKGHVFPKGTVFILYIYGMNRDSDYHESPDEFKPERFLNVGNPPFSYVPFSAGPRNCIGQKFAILEMKSMISKILRHFKLYPTDPPHTMKMVNEAVLKSSNGVNIRLKKQNWTE